MVIRLFLSSFPDEESPEKQNSFINQIFSIVFLILFYFWAGERVD